MFLRRYVLETIESFNNASPETKQLIDPIAEAIGKFLMIHYDFRDIEKIARIYNGYTNDTVSKRLKEYHENY